jgi:hypothetical protein
MSEELPYFHKMLAALLDCPADLQLDQTRARIVLDSAGSDVVEAAIKAGDAFASALYRLAMGETRQSLFKRIEAAAAQARTDSAE